MIDTLINYFKKFPVQTIGEAPDGICPNCWGEQEYDGAIRKMYVDKQIDVNNHEANYAFIQDFVVNKISGIKLIKENNKLICPSCKVTF
jgi:hypothetical protein